MTIEIGEMQRETNLTDSILMHVSARRSVNAPVLDGYHFKKEITVVEVE